MKEMFPPEKCPKCGVDTVVMHYDNGYRVECPNNPKCDWYGVFHFDEGSPTPPPPSEAINP